MKLNGTVSISRVSGRPANPISIRFMDEDSGIVFAEADMTLEDFAEALTGMMGSKASIEVRGLEKLGTVEECEYFTIPRYKGERSESKEALLAHLKKHGPKGKWIGFTDDLGNHHNFKPNNMVAVRYRRWVKKKEKR